MRKAKGDAAEEVAVDFLEKAGYEILARNFHCRWGELDVVARRREVIAVVEVRMRTRSTHGFPVETIGFDKQHRLVKAALHFFQAARLPRLAVRFDVISVLGTGLNVQVEHIENAFDAGF